MSTKKRSYRILLFHIFLERIVELGKYLLFFKILTCIPTSAKSREWLDIPLDTCTYVFQMMFPVSAF